MFCGGQKRLRLFRRPLLVVPVVDKADDLFVVIKGIYDHGEHQADRRDQGGHAHPVVGGVTVGRAEIHGVGHDGRDPGLGELGDELAGRHEHARPVLAGFDAVVLGHVGKGGGRQDVGAGDGKRHAHADQDGCRNIAHHGPLARKACQKAGAQGRGADGLGDGGVEVDAQINGHIGGAGGQQQRLFAEAAHQGVHQRVGADAHHDADGQHDGGKALVQAQQGVDVEQQRAVEKGKARLHDEIPHRHHRKVFVGEGGLEALQKGHIAAFAHHIVPLVDQKRGNERAGRADDRKDGQRPAPGPHRGQARALKAAHHDRQRIDDRAAQHEHQRVEGVEKHPAARVGHDFLLQSHVGHAVQGGGHVVGQQHGDHPGHVHPAHVALWREEDEQAGNGVGHGGPAHKGQPPPLGRSAAVADAGDPGVGDGVEDDAHAPQKAHHAGGQQQRQAGRGGHIEKLQGVGDDQAAQHRPGKFAQAQAEHAAVREFFFHSAAPLYPLQQLFAQQLFVLFRLLGHGAVGRVLEPDKSFVRRLDGIEIALHQGAGGVVVVPALEDVERHLEPGALGGEVTLDGAGPHVGQAFFVAPRQADFVGEGKLLAAEQGQGGVGPVGALFHGVAAVFFHDAALGHHALEYLPVAAVYRAADLV